MPTSLAGFMQVQVHIKRHLMKELPESEDAVAQWCKDIFVAKVVAVDIASSTFVISWSNLYIGKITP